MSHLSIDMDVSSREMRVDTSVIREIYDIILYTEGVDGFLRPIKIFLPLLSI